MIRRPVIVLMIFSLLSIFFINGCKTTEEIIKDFVIVSASGYSKKVTTLDPDDTGLTSINLFFAIRNHGDVAGTITGWVFKIRHNIVTLLEINNNNYKDYNLVITGGINIPSNEIKEIYVSTPLPSLENALSKEKLSFDQYIPSEVIVEVEVTDDNGKTHTITGRGSYTYEQGVINETKYNIVGKWDFNRTVNSSKKAKQKIVFVGTKVSGNFAIYNYNTNDVENTGTYFVNNFKYLSFTSTDGTQYWGEFTEKNQANGTLIIQFDDRGRPLNSTGTWTANKL